MIRLLVSDWKVNVAVVFANAASSMAIIATHRLVTMGQKAGDDIGTGFL